MITYSSSSSSSSSTNIFQKYFPGLPLRENIQTPSEVYEHFFSTPLSVSVFSTAIHSCSNVERNQGLWRLDFLSKFQKVVFRGKLVQRRRRNAIGFASVAQVISMGSQFSEIINEKVEDQKEEEEIRKADPEVEKRKGKTTWGDMPKFLLAGAVSTIVSRTFVAPLERIKLECIVQGSKCTWTKTVQWIWLSEGLMGFWKGNMLNLFRMVPFKSINFICYDMYIDGLQRIPGKKQITNHDRIVGGGISGLTATVLCLPLDTIRTRLMAPGGQALGGVCGCFRHMIQKEGFLSLYKGLTPTLISMGPSSAVFYGMYDILKASYFSRKTKHNVNKFPHELEQEIGPIRTLVYGAISGACAETITYPFEVIRRQLQLQKDTKIGVISAFSKLMETDGVESLFAGLVPSTLQVLPSASLSYLFYEMMKTTLEIK